MQYKQKMEQIIRERLPFHNKANVQSKYVIRAVAGVGVGCCVCCILYTVCSVVLGQCALCCYVIRAVAGLCVACCVCCILYTVCIVVLGQCALCCYVIRAVAGLGVELPSCDIFIYINKVWKQPFINICTIKNNAICISDKKFM